MNNVNINNIDNGRDIDIDDDKEVYWFATRDGEIFFASQDYDEVENFVENTQDILIHDTAEEYDWDLNDPVEYEKTIIQNNIDYGLFEIYNIPKEQLIADEEFELDDGTVIEINDIISSLNENENNN